VDESSLRSTIRPRAPGGCRRAGALLAYSSICSHTRFYQQALALIASGAVPVADLITHRLPLDGAIEGIHTVTRGEGIKVTVET
jgi:threonine dehydrogenase-like Zn-dependent dehydrogenase